MCIFVLTNIITDFEIIAVYLTSLFVRINEIYEGINIIIARTVSRR